MNRITWELDDSEKFSNIKPYDMYVDGKRVYAWLCFYISSRTWKFQGAKVIEEYPERATRAEAQADGIAWWTAQELERYK